MAPKSDSVEGNRPSIPNLLSLWIEFHILFLFSHPIPSKSGFPVLIFITFNQLGVFSFLLIPNPHSVILLSFEQVISRPNSSLKHWQLFLLLILQVLCWSLWMRYAPETIWCQFNVCEGDQLLDAWFMNLWKIQYGIQNFVANEKLYWCS